MLLVLLPLLLPMLLPLLLAPVFAVFAAVAAFVTAFSAVFAFCFLLFWRLCCVAASIFRFFNPSSWFEELFFISVHLHFLTVFFFLQGPVFGQQPCAMDHDAMSCAHFIDAAQRRRCLGRGRVGENEKSRCFGAAWLSDPKWPLQGRGDKHSPPLPTPSSVRWCVPLLPPQFVFHPFFFGHHPKPGPCRDTLPEATRQARWQRRKRESEEAKKE